jgi:TRAP-type C4-dicarboxylate transport system permease small subunit
MGMTRVRIWSFLDRVYLGCGYLAAFAMVGIFLVTLAQIISRPLGIELRGSTDYAGYLMAASAFLAFAHALNRGAHVRIELFLSMLGRHRLWGERVCFLAAAAIATWFAYHCCAQTYLSYVLGDVSQGLDATPIWIPQLSMAIGASLLALAVADHALRLFLTGDHGIELAPDAV